MARIQEMMYRQEGSGHEHGSLTSYPIIGRPVDKQANHWTEQRTDGQTNQPPNRLVHREETLAIRGNVRL